jgi:hypothetical protein
VSFHRLRPTTERDKSYGNPFSWLPRNARVARHFNSRNSYHDDWRHALRYFLYDCSRGDAALDAALQGNTLAELVPAGHAFVRNLRRVFDL